jgi:hypothetical protein
VPKKSSVALGCKVSFKFFEFKWISQCNGVPGDGRPE